MINLLKLLISPALTIAGYVGAYVSHRQELKELERKAEVALAEKMVEANYDADTHAILDRKTSMKDDIVFYTIWGMFWGALIPYTRPHVLAAVQAMSVFPEWFMLLVILSFVDVSGLRVLATKFILPRFTGKK